VRERDSNNNNNIEFRMNEVDLINQWILFAAPEQDRSLWHPGQDEPGPVGGLSDPHIALPLLPGHFRPHQDASEGQ